MTAQGPIVTPLIWEDALDLADAAIYRDPGDSMADRIARALMRVDVASREQAQPPKHDEATCQTCAAIKARRGDEVGEFYLHLGRGDARDTGGECGD